MTGEGQERGRYEKPWPLCTEVRRDILMNPIIDRREFLKASMTTGAVLLVGEGFLEGAFAQNKPKFAELDKLSIAIITDNYYDSLRADAAIGKRYRATVEKSIHAEHGLSYYVETSSGGKTNSFMFDYGVDPRGVLRNMELLGINLEKIDGMGLSHGHWDHWGALVGILKANQGKIPRGTPFYVGEEAFFERFSVRSGSEPRSIGKLKMEDVEALGGLRIVEVTAPTEVMKGGYYSGRIERVTDYEKIPASFHIKRGEKLEHDQFPGEQALIFIVKGKGLVVLVGCAHPGIVNTVKYAQKITGVQKVHAVLGGFHLVNSAPESVQRSVMDIKAISPDYIVPTHCTGFEAITLFQKEMPKQFVLNTAGTRYVF
jgi:7,8-dihydropterin-6-yl-methyl-4-(beta-D-ribofuranosyl)aminobenzene 5'-phosphate synthase